MNEAARYDIHDFQREVIERSFQIPVVVDFWAAWCGPCKILGPILERLAGQQSDRWVLAKVDTEELVEEAMRYGVQGIPNVKMFFRGNIVGEFVGALPEYSVTQWLKNTLPDKHKDGIEKAQQLLDEHRENEARAVLDDILRDDPANPSARMLLAKILIFREPHYAERVVNEVEDPKFSDVRDMLSTLLYLSGLPGQAGHLPENPVKARYLNAVHNVLRGQFGEALKEFISIIRDDRYYDDDGSRKACIAIFRYLGDNNPVTVQYRREFSSALY